MTLLTGSCNWCIIYRPENKFRHFRGSSYPVDSIFASNDPYQNVILFAYFNVDHARNKCLFYGLVCKLLKITIRFGISGSSHRRKLKLSPMKITYKRWLSVMSSLWSRHKCEFYRLENKPIVSVIKEEVWFCIYVKCTETKVLMFDNVW